MAGVGPFTQAAFSADPNGALTNLDIKGGIVPNGGGFGPGSGKADGQLWISPAGLPSVIGTNSFVRSFKLSERPTGARPVPLPASVWSGLGLFGAGAFLRLIRRRFDRPRGERRAPSASPLQSVAYPPDQLRPGSA